MEYIDYSIFHVKPRCIITRFVFTFLLYEIHLTKYFTSMRARQRTIYREILRVMQKNYNKNKNGIIIENTTIILIVNQRSIPFELIRIVGLDSD